MATHAPRSRTQAHDATHAAAAPHLDAGAVVQRFADRRPEAAAQRRLVDAIEGAPMGSTVADGLPPRLRAGLESLSGLPMSDVRVHYDSTRPTDFDARAFASGRDIHLAPGEARHLPHEAWHVVQQAQGRVGALHPEDINSDPTLEREADVMGARAARTGLTADVGLGAPTTAEASRTASTTPVIQRVRGTGRGRRQKKRIEEQGGTAPVLPGRAVRRRAAQEADLQATAASVEVRHEEHQRTQRRKEGYAAHKARVRRADANRRAQEKRHETQRSKRTQRESARVKAHQEQTTEETERLERRDRIYADVALQQELAQIGSPGQLQPPQPVAQLPVAQPPQLGPADQFAADHPDAIRIRPMDSLKKVLKGTDFESHQSFVTSAFNAPSPRLPRFDGHTVYHDTQGGGGGGFTVFGVIVGGDQFLIGHGRHKRDDADAYKLNWSCDQTVAGWDGAEVRYA
ncbi:MAG: DUF4157 domain-containing protein [Vicinamibacterales bacterium]